MTYYWIQSWQINKDGNTTGEEVLKKGEGDSVPESSFLRDGNGWINNEYFSTYEEAKKRFDFILECYHKGNLYNINIKRYNEITGESSSFIHSNQ